MERRNSGMEREEGQRSSSENIYPEVAWSPQFNRKENYLVSESIYEIGSDREVGWGREFELRPPQSSHFNIIPPYCISGSWTSRQEITCVVKNSNVSMYIIKVHSIISLHTWTGWIRPWFKVSAITLRAKWRTLDCAWKKASRTCLRYSCMIELLIPEEISPISFRSSCFATFFPMKKAKEKNLKELSETVISAKHLPN